MNISYDYGCKNPQLNIRKLNPATYERDYKLWTTVIYPRNARVVQYMKTDQCRVHHINRTKDMTISIDVGKIFDKIYPFIAKIFNNPGTEENILILIKYIYTNHTNNVSLSGKDWKFSP